jgi:hypothetical protein
MVFPYFPAIAISFRHNIVEPQVVEDLEDFLEHSRLSEA